MAPTALLANMRKVDISPLPEHLPPVEEILGRNIRAYQEVTHPLGARILVLKQGVVGLVIIALDTCSVADRTADVFRKRISRETGVPPENVLLCASHSHTAMGVDLNSGFEAWTCWMMEKVSVAAGKAWHARRKARAGVGYGYRYGVCFNQRLPQSGIRTKFVRDFVESRGGGRPIDPRVGVLRIDEMSGELMGVMVNFAAHPATLINHPDVTPDFPGFIAQYVERKRPGAIVGFLQGACGDLNIDYMFTTLGAAEYTGSLIGKEVDRILDDITTSADLPINVVRKEYRLPLEKMPAEGEIGSWERGCDGFLKASETDPTRLWVNEWNMPEYVRASTRRDMVQKLRNWCDWIREHREQIAKIVDVGYEMVAVRIGDLMALFHPFEAFVEVGLELQRLSAFRHMWLVGYTNGLKGYLPTAEEYRRGGYEPNCQRYAQDLNERPRNLAENAASVFVEQALQLIREFSEANGGP